MIRGSCGKNMINSQEPLLAPRKAPLVGNCFKVGMKDYVDCQISRYLFHLQLLDTKVEVQVSKNCWHRDLATILETQPKILQEQKKVPFTSTQYYTQIIPHN